LSPGSPADGPAGLLAVGLGFATGFGLGAATLADAGLAVAELAAAAPALEVVAAEGEEGPADPGAEPATDAGAGSEGRADLLVAVQPAVTRIGASSSTAIVRRMRPSSLMEPGLTPWRAGPYSWRSARFKMRLLPRVR